MAEDGTQLQTALYDIPQNATVARGKCEATSSKMEINADHLKVELAFMLNETSKQYNMKMIMQMNVQPDQFENAGKYKMELINFIIKHK